MEEDNELREDLPIEVPPYEGEENPEDNVIESEEFDQLDDIDKLLSNVSNREKDNEDAITVASLRAENESLKNTIQILSERYDNKCQEFDKLMKSYIKVRQQLGLDPPKSRSMMAGLPQPAPEYRARIQSDYWN